ncbi:MAG: hypothetical protein C5S48_04935 [Candidatus Methanogaster sp.]|nr:MAG: hypothetical protein C5S48_04935 [ANME-2 cluster archaeon]
MDVVKSKNGVPIGLMGGDGFTLQKSTYRWWVITLKSPKRWRNRGQFMTVGLVSA